MTIPTMEGADPGEEASVSTPFPNTWWGRASYVLFLVVLPAFSFFSIELLKPDWQTGKLSDYAILFLFPEASLLFFPLLAYSIVCYLLLLFQPTRFARSFVVRLGIYVGALLALQYSILVMIAGGSAAFVMVLTWIFPLIYSILYNKAIARWTAQKVNRFLFILALGVLLLGSLVTRGSVAFLVLIGLIMAAPFWSLLLSLLAANWLIKNYETRFTFSRAFGLTTWLAAYAAAWRFDILKMYKLYAALPPQPPPDCYIATAAAQGHPQLVGSWLVRRTNGETMRVNKQLQILKCAELALLAVKPGAHKMFRRVYDIIGKSLAKRMQNRLLADVAYLLLKPCDWLARLLLRRLVPEIDSISKKLYTN